MRVSMRQIRKGNESVGIQRSSYIAYGAKIHPLPDETWWKICDDQDGKVTDDVQLTLGGAYDQDEHFLVTFFKEIEPGQAFFVPPYSATDPKYLQWDAAIVKAAEMIGATLVLHHGWVFIPDES